MKSLVISAFSLLTILTACGPAAENREYMIQRSKVFQDSIASVIKAQLAEAEAPGPQIIAPAPTPAVNGLQPTTVQPTPVPPNVGVNVTK